MQTEPSTNPELGQSFDSLSLKTEFGDEFIDFFLRDEAQGLQMSEQQPLSSEETEPTANSESFVFNESPIISAVEPKSPLKSDLSTEPLSTTNLPPPPPLSSPSEGLDEAFAELTDIFPLLSDLSEPLIKSEEEEEEIEETGSHHHATEVKEEKENKRKSSQKKKNPRASKKLRTEPQPSNFIESLRGMNSTQLEHYAETQPLTEAQHVELKEWIRKIKNRESASQSRQNRKNHQQELEGKIEALDTSNSRLREQITELQIENRVLLKELEDFKGLVERSNLGQAFALYNNTKKAPARPPSSNDDAASAKPEASAPASTATAATPATTTSNGIQLSDVILKAMSGGKPNKEGMALVLYLLMALHSYGQYWNKVTAQYQVALPQPDELTARA